MTSGSAPSRLAPVPAVLATVAAAAGVLAVTVTPAAGASCAQMRAGYAFTSGRVLAIDPPRVEVPFGGCVQFTNNTATTVTFRVAGGYEQRVMPAETTPQRSAYVGQASGRHEVTASNGPTSASGTIAVGVSPSPSPSRSRASASPGSSPSRSPRPSTSPTGGTTGPQVAPTPPPAAPRSGGPLPTIRATPSPTPSRTVGTNPSPAPSPSATPAVVAGPIEPASGRGIGLPAAVAALLLVGTGAGLLRVLAAEPIGPGRPVDDARTVGGGA